MDLLKPIYIATIVCLFLNEIHAQENFYQQDIIQEIKIYFTESNWDDILDSLYVQGEEERHLARIEINGTTLDSVGIRYKGFSSVSINRKKNPFNIKLNFVNNQSYDGIDKIKLSNVIQDPSFLREVLAYDIAKNYMPCPRANFAKVYINDIYWGLYTNVEAVDKEFIIRHFPLDNNPLFKCNPQSLDFDGENSNLGNHPGTDTSAYYPFYELRSDQGWNNLLDLIQVLNDSPENIESVLNVDQALWMHAFNYALINFDSYIGYAQNYYLYQDQNGRFNPIIWDLNQSFGSFRLTDASEHFNGFTISEAKNMDPLLHYSSFSVIPRPLLRHLFENDTYRKMYMAHLKSIMESHFATNLFQSKAQELHNLIRPDVYNDLNKFYTNEAFDVNLDTTVRDLVSYPGLMDLMRDRTSFFRTYPGYNEDPEIDQLSHFPTNPQLGDQVFITAQVLQASEVVLSYRYSKNDLFEKVAMVDDGLHNDGTANDNIYGAAIANLKGNLEYFIYAENDDAGKFSPEQAAYRNHELKVEIQPGTLVINEFMASNDETITDEYGEFDDWIELFNPSNDTIELGQFYLTDDLSQLDKWALPNVALTPNEYIIIWADGSPNQGERHANFKLSASGEEIGLSLSNGTLMDQITYTEVGTDVSIGRIPNGTGDFRNISPSPGSINSITSTSNLNKLPWRIVENPVQNRLQIIFEQQPEKSSMLEIYNALGQQIHGPILIKDQNILINVSNFPSGQYLLSLQSQGHAESRSFVKIN